jgi:hypothetical protein
MGKFGYVILAAIALAVVGAALFTNGHDSSSRVRRSQLIAELPKEDDTRGTRVFTIGYGNKPDEELLREMSERSNAVTVKGDVADVEKLCHQLSAYS